MRSAMVLTGLLLLSACSSAPVDSGFAWNPPDAGPGADGPTNTCDSATNVWHHTQGSWLLTAPQVHVIMWGNYWATNKQGQTEMNSLMSEWNILANDPSFYAPVSQYGIGAGYLASFDSTNWEVPTGQLSEQTIVNALDSEITTGAISSPNTNTVYVILLPPDTQSQDDVQNNFGGHHDNYKGYAYAVIEYHIDSTFAMTHEIWEAATDPDGHGWWGPGGETEVADLCETQASWTLDGYNIPQVWGQQNCACIK